MWLLGALVFVWYWDVADACASAHASAVRRAERRGETDGFARGVAVGMTLSDPPPPRWRRAAALIGAGLLGALLGVTWAALVHYW